MKNNQREIHLRYKTGRIIAENRYRAISGDNMSRNVTVEYMDLEWFEKNYKEMMLAICSIPKESLVVVTDSKTNRMVACDKILFKIGEYFEDGAINERTFTDPLKTGIWLLRRLETASSKQNLGKYPEAIKILSEALVLVSSYGIY